MFLSFNKKIQFLNDILLYIAVRLGVRLRVVPLSVGFLLLACPLWSDCASVRLYVCLSTSLLDYLLADPSCPAVRFFRTHVLLLGRRLFS